MTLANTIATSRDQALFAVLETTKGTLVFPAATDIMVPAGDVTMKQQPSFTDSDEVVNSRDIINRFQDRMPAAEWTIPIYARPSGTAGTAPQGDALLEALTGTKTVVASTSVAYTPAITKKSLSIWWRVDHLMMFLRGATVNNCKVSVATKGGFKLELSGGAMQLGFVGTGEIDGSHSSSDTDISVIDADLFTVGGVVQFISGSSTFNNSASGYEVTAVNTTTNVVTITPGLEDALADEDTIKPYLPSGTAIGTPLENRKAVASVDGTSKTVTKMDVDINDPAVFMEDEVTTTDWVEDFVGDVRKISGTIGMKLRRTDVKYFTETISGSEVATKLTVGTEAGDICEFEFPQSVLEVPALAPAHPTVDLEMGFLAIGSAGEDSYSITFT